MYNKNIEKRMIMEQTYSKNYFEKYATLSLLDILNIQENHIIQADCPDLQIPYLNYGIEVTQALTPEEAVADKKKQLYCQLNMNPFNSFQEDIDFLKWKILDALKRKEEKSKHYLQFQKNGLYIFTHCYSFNKEDILACFENYSIHNSFYQYIYFNCVTHIYCLSTQTLDIQTYSYSIDQLITMNNQSLEYEKTCHKKRRKIIIPNQSQ